MLETGGYTAFEDMNSETLDDDRRERDNPQQVRCKEVSA